MKKANWIAKKLQLRKDCVRILTSRELDIVAGGAGCGTTESEHSKLPDGAIPPPTTC